MVYCPILTLAATLPRLILLVVSWTAKSPPKLTTGVSALRCGHKVWFLDVRSYFEEVLADSLEVMRMIEPSSLHSRLSMAMSLIVSRSRAVAEYVRSLP